MPQVREEDLSVVRLTDLTIPEAIRTASHAIPTAEASAPAEGNGVAAGEAGYAALTEVVGPEVGAELESFFRAIIKQKEEKQAGHPAKKAKTEEGEAIASPEEEPSEAPEPVPQTFVLPEMKEKERRTQVHNAVKQHFPWCATDTVKHEDGTSRIRIMTRALAKSGDKRKHDLGRVDGRTIHEWPAGRPDFLKFTMFKFNMDTIAAVGELAYQLHMPQKVFGYAGTKDRRGVTCQEVTLHKTDAEKVPDPSPNPNPNPHWTDAEKVAGLNRRLRQIKLGNFSYVPKARSLGKLEP